MAVCMYLGGVRNECFHEELLQHGWICSQLHRERNNRGKGRYLSTSRSQSWNSQGLSLKLVKEHDDRFMHTTPAGARGVSLSLCSTAVHFKSSVVVSLSRRDSRTTRFSPFGMYRVGVSADENMITARATLVYEIRKHTDHIPGQPADPWCSR